MIVTLVHVWVKTEHVSDFIRASKENHEHSIKEPGNLRFDLIQSADDATKFVIYEAYESEEASMAHKSTNHYKKWRAEVADWMAQPREGEKHLIIAPASKLQ